MRPRQALFLVLWLATASASWAQDPGSLVIIGGGLQADNGPVYRAILERALPDRPICVLPTASAEPQRSMDSYLADFLRWSEEYGVGPTVGTRGAAARGVPITKDDAAKAHDADVVADLADCGGIFFTGGDQSRIADVFRPDGEDSPAYEALLRLHREGAVIAGTSAGAAVMSDPMIGGGSSEDALLHGVVDADPLIEGNPSGVWIRDGVGFLPGAIVDQHFLARGRFGRLMVAARHLLQGRQDPLLAVGVGENTALVVDAPGTDAATVHVIGPSAVVLVEMQPGDPEHRIVFLRDGDPPRRLP